MKLESQSGRLTQVTRVGSYHDLLRHPKWQRKRLEIMQRAEFKCERCGARDPMLAIHHSYYEKGCPPWGYPDSSLHCLCERCHEYAQLMMTALHRQIGRLSIDDIERLLGYGKGLEIRRDSNAEIRVHSLNLADGVADVFRVRSADVLKEVHAGKLCTPLRCKRRLMPVADADIAG